MNKDDAGSVDLWKNKFKIVKNGLDQDQVFSFVNDLLDLNKELTGKLQHIDSLTKLAEKTVIEADRQAEATRIEAQEEANIHAATVIADAEERAKAEAARIIGEAQESKDESDRMIAESEQKAKVEADRIISESQQTRAESERMISEAEQRAKEDADRIIAEASDKARIDAQSIIAEAEGQARFQADNLIAGAEEKAKAEADSVIAEARQKAEDTINEGITQAREQAQGILEAAEKEAEAIKIPAEEEAARVISEARQKAEEAEQGAQRIIREAEENVQLIKSATEEESSKIIAEAKEKAEQLLEAKRAQAEEDSQRILTETRERAEAEAQAIRKEAELLLQKSKQIGEDQIKEKFRKVYEGLLEDIGEIAGMPSVSEETTDVETEETIAEPSTLAEGEITEEAIEEPSTPVSQLEEDESGAALTVQEDITLDETVETPELAQELEAAEILTAVAQDEVTAEEHLEQPAPVLEEAEPVSFDQEETVLEEVEDQPELMQKAEVVAEEVAALYEGTIELAIPPPVGLDRMLQLHKNLRHIPQIEVMNLGVSRDKGITIRLFIDSPIPLLKILGELPEVENVSEPYEIVADKAQQKPDGEKSRVRRIVVTTQK